MTVLETKFMELACSFFEKFKQPSRKDHVRYTAANLIPNMPSNISVEESVARAIQYAIELEKQLDELYGNK